MENKEIIIKVCNDRIFLNPWLSIPIQHTNIPKEHLTFRTHKDIFWRVKLLGYKADVKCLKVSVTEYKLSDTTGYEEQKPSKGIDKLYFEKFNWMELEPLLTYYHKSKLSEYIFNDKVSYFSRSEEQSHHVFTTQGQHIKPKSHTARFTENFGVHFHDCHFMLGYVTFKKHINYIGKEINFEIPNEHILEEFDNIKFWFAKKLKTKKIRVSATISIKDGEVIKVNATSKHIDQITPKLIDSVKYQRTFSLTKEPKLSNPDKSLFTADEIFTQIDSDDIEGNVFKQSEEDILNFFIEERDVRNKKQLSYLAGKKQSSNYKLRYTLNPNFGFLFLIEGKKNNHFVWELLNSNATYIWSIEKGEQNVELQYSRIENIVNTIRTNGRENYKREYRNNYMNDNIVFRILKHKNISSQLVDDFPGWKSGLNEQLT